MCAIQEVFVGKTKESLDVVDSECIIGDISQVFGPYVKFIVVEADGEVNDRLRMLNRSILKL